jgi:hypothetical protein
LTLLQATAGCIHPTCNAVCEDSISVQSDLPVTADALSGAQVEFCRNADCATSTVETIAAGTPSYQSRFSGQTFEVGFWVEPQADGSTSVTFAYYAETGAKDYANGDVYRVRIVSASGSTLLAGSVTAHYSSQEECGTHCHGFAGTL